MMTGEFCNIDIYLQKKYLIVKIVFSTEMYIIT